MSCLCEDKSFQFFGSSEEGLEDEVVGIHLGKFSEVVIQEDTGVSAPGFPS